MFLLKKSTLILFLICFYIFVNISFFNYVENFYQELNFFVIKEIFYPTIFSKLILNFYTNINFYFIIMILILLLVMIVLEIKKKKKKSFFNFMILSFLMICGLQLYSFSTNNRIYYSIYFLIFNFIYLNRILYYLLGKNEKTQNK